MNKEKSFKPLLAPNEKIDLNEIKYPLLASTKLDGIRVIFYKGQILTRSLKQLPNKQLREKFEDIRKYSEDNNIILDGELYSHELNFQEIISFCMTEDFEDKKSIKKFGKVMEIPDSLIFYCFDGIKDDNYLLDFCERNLYHVQPLLMKFPKLIGTFLQKYVYTKEDVDSYFEEVLNQGYEGLILRDPNGRYKFGRGTVKEAIIYKVKPFIDFDGQIINVVQATEVNEDAEKR